MITPTPSPFDPPEPSTRDDAALVHVGARDAQRDMDATDPMPGLTTKTDGRPRKGVLTFTALNTFRNCPRKYRHRYVDQLQPREKAESLSFGAVVHGALERWYRATGDVHRLWTVLDYIDAQYPNRAGNPRDRYAWQLARTMMAGYAARYAAEDFEVIEIEKVFEGPICNPDTCRTSRTFIMSGKVDGIVATSDGHYLLEHKTAASVDENYLDRLWTDTQIALYCFYLREMGYPIVGVIYNVLLKTRIQRHPGETQEEYEARRAALAAKNKSGRSTAQRQVPETDDEFQARLAEWYAKPEAFHRERVSLSEDRLAMLQEEVWEITQQYLSARHRDKWLLNTSNCFSYQRPCEYLLYCQSGFNPNVRDNLFEIRPPHEELVQLSVSAPASASQQTHF